MDIQFVEQLIDLVEKSGLAELEFSANGKRLRLTKTVSPQGRISPSLVAAPASGTTRPAAAVRPEPAAEPVAAAVHRIVAGLGGTLFTRPSPGESPFVKVGDVVEEGQVLAIIEAMKMLNSVECDVSGVIAKICVEDGAAIVSGAEIFLIQPR